MKGLVLVAAGAAFYVSAFYLGRELVADNYESTTQGSEISYPKQGEKFIKNDYAVCIAEKYLEAPEVDQNYCMPSADLTDYRINRVMHYKKGVSEVTLSFPDDTIAIVWVNSSALGDSYGY